MEFRTLRYFLAVADAENLSKAAETVHTTQPNLTRQIKALEEELGQELFIRSRGMQLTPAGELLRKRAEQICDLYELADEEIRFFGKGKRIAGTIRIAAGESSSITSVARAVARLQKEHPLIKIDIKSCDTREVVESLHRGLCDFGILVEPAPIGEFNCLRLPSYDRWGGSLLERKPSVFPRESASGRSPGGKDHTQPPRRIYGHNRKLARKENEVRRRCNIQSHVQCVAAGQRGRWRSLWARRDSRFGRRNPLCLRSVGSANP